jgi:hypothetical protein
MVGFIDVSNLLLQKALFKDQPFCLELTWLFSISPEMRNQAKFFSSKDEAWRSNNLPKTGRNSGSQELKVSKNLK